MKLAVDITGSFPQTDQGNQYIPVVINYFSKCVEGYALPIQEIVTAAEALVKDWICRFGVLLKMHFDHIWT